MIQIEINDTDIGFCHRPDIQEPCTVLDLLFRIGKLPGSQFLVRSIRHGIATWAGPGFRLIDQDRVIIVPVNLKRLGSLTPVDPRAIVVPVAREPFGPDCGPGQLCRQCHKCYASYVDAKMAGAT